ncbi:hypothetical protein HGG76_26820 [Ochrobactrum tritici]|uniref:Outer membrane autotransporter n=1 Tax=Brucella tritici TaxID=94626 RepID=A0A7X6FVK2_9HYPH|nr:hypothetical protein [Brucella tritici]
MGMRFANNDLNTVGGKIVATDTDIETSGDWAHGAFADNGGDITLNGGTVTTLGARAFGILASKNSTVTSSAAITTKGIKHTASKLARTAVLQMAQMNLL